MIQTQRQLDKEYPSIYTTGKMPYRTCQVMEEGWKAVGTVPGQNTGPKTQAGKVDLKQEKIALKTITEGDAVSIMRKMNKIRKQFDENYTSEDLDEKLG